MPQVRKRPSLKMKQRAKIASLLNEPYYAFTCLDVSTEKLSYSITLKLFRVDKKIKEKTPCASVRVLLPSKPYVANTALLKNVIVIEMIPNMIRKYPVRNRRHAVYHDITQLNNVGSYRRL